ncbi:aspartate aminotransferase family protein [Rhodococcus triatomae]|uniref:Glutamate or tyrosine decarboxylase n=1 Tax=Rhodococcus triatomae TaxID=300028 RepID=A0A1G8CVS0_9NOCA|nr:aminotransferase class V-fold PLP-dependent enzyme [Rhodococcus triatomae]QNG18568.1 aspartate aminotransferase family protein [Rhodococcus triatomae]QNG21763.1 aspartate aminotransferase family protein [Rhodococcus triatomae]SDH49555.1 Glutamate or tyrosine decarboxylase [Rhodococcus triatomae]
MSEELTPRALDALRRLEELRRADAPTHGGRVLSYVYDSGLAEIDEIAARAARLVQPVNGLDPTVFPSTVAMERDLIAFGRRMLHGESGVVGNVTSGGTESCILAVASARDTAGASPGAGSVVAPTTVHAAFAKAAHLLGLELVRVPVDPGTGAVRVDAFTEALREDTVLAVVSAPNYPIGAIDPVAEVAAATSARGIPLHVDACLGGWALPWWGDTPEPLPEWDFRVPGVGSISADLHKYGYAPKGVSLLLYRDRDRHRAQYFGITDWPGYPVVNPTLAGSKSAAALASAWAITETLGDVGYRGLVDRIRRATESLCATVDSVEGLRVVGQPRGPVFAVASDADSGTPIDPHVWANAVRERGFTLQMQPSMLQPDGTVLARTTHLTVTPVTETLLPDLEAVLRAAAEEVRGAPPAAPPDALAALSEAFADGSVSAADVLALPGEAVAGALAAAGLDPRKGTAGSAGEAGEDLDMATVLAAVEALPRPVTTRMLVEYLAGLLDE